MSENVSIFIGNDYFDIRKISDVMCKACEVGKIVVNKCLDRNVFINTQKLQKLLVLMQIECIKRSNKPLFKEDIRIWDCGVAIKEVDEEFSQFAVSFPNQKLTEYITLLDAEEQSVEVILSQYGDFETCDINETTAIAELINGYFCDNQDSPITPHITVDYLQSRYGRKVCKDDD